MIRRVVTLALVAAPVVFIACSSPGETVIVEQQPASSASTPTPTVDAADSSVDANDAGAVDAADTSIACTGTPSAESVSDTCHAIGACLLTGCADLVAYDCGGGRPNGLATVEGMATIADGGMVMQMCGAPSCVRNDVPCPGDQVGWNCPAGMVPPSEPSCVAPAPEGGATVSPGDTCCL